MSATAQAPRSLKGRDDFIVRYDQATDTLTLLLDDVGNSFDIGSFTSSYADAVPYLARAMGGGLLNTMFAEEIVSTARNFGTALVDLSRRVSVPVHDDSIRRAEQLTHQAAVLRDPYNMLGHIDESQSRRSSAFVEPSM